MEVKREQQIIKDGKKAFKALAKRYASITMKEIEEAAETVKDQLYLVQYGYAVAGELTGFGTENCTLCIAASTSSCNGCHWTIKTDFGCGGHFTYKGIYNSEDKVQLKRAFKARSKYMKEFL